MSTSEPCAIAAAVHELQERVDAEPKADEGNRSDWRAVLFAVTELHLHVREKLTAATVPCDDINDPRDAVGARGSGTGDVTSHAEPTFTHPAGP